MNSIPEDQILRFHPNTMETLRNMYNLEKPGDMDNAITVLEEWLKKHQHLTRKEYPRAYLERSIIFQKGSLERTKAQINNICAMRTLLPEYFVMDDTVYDIAEREIGIAGLLPKLTEDNYRVFAVKMLVKEINAQMLFRLYRRAIQFAEYSKIHDYCCGLILVIDYRDVNIMDYVSVCNFTEFYHFIKIMTAGYSMRVKGIHIVTPSKAVYAVYNMVKKMLSSKIANHMYLHANIDELYEFLPRNILPAEFGGYDTTLANLCANWKDVLGAEKMVEYYKEMSQAKSTDTHKMKEAITDGDLGISGSFRYLNVD